MAGGRDGDRDRRDRRSRSRHGSGAGGSRSGGGKWSKDQWKDWNKGKEKPSGGSGDKTQDLMQEVGKMLELNGKKREGWKDIADMKTKFKLSESVELGLKILAPEHLRKLLGSSIQWRLAEVADKDKLVRSIIAKFDSRVDELIQKLEDKEKEIEKAPASTIPWSRNKARSRSRGGGSGGYGRGGRDDKKDESWGRGGKDSNSGYGKQQGGWKSAGQTDSSKAQQGTGYGGAAASGSQNAAGGYANRSQATGYGTAASTAAAGYGAAGYGARGAAGASAAGAVPRVPLASQAMIPQAAGMAAPANALGGGTLPSMRAPGAVAAANSGLPRAANALNPMRPMNAVQQQAMQRQQQMGQVVPGRPAGYGQAPAARATAAAAAPAAGGAAGQADLVRALNVANLQTFVGPLSQLGVERAADLAYVTDADLKAMNMNIIQQRKFRDIMAQKR